MIIPKNKDWPLAYFQSGEWQVVKEKLDDEDDNFNPGWGHLFDGLKLVPCERVRVAILGQDPYPDRMYCTGVAFSVPQSAGIPPSLKNIFKEYQDDLGFPPPRCGDLTKWCEQGVLLWNVYPSCRTGQPGSHHWLEWEYLTKEILELIDGKATVVFLGNRARSFARYCTKSPTICTSHPSPLGARYGFFGSRIFSKINATLEQPIDWRLDDGS